jgi:two-component system, NtrC family, sensor histidine kinase GlrK
MRLVSRLIFSHMILPGAFVLVLGFMLAALTRMNGLIDQVREHYLDAIDEDEELHRAGWAVEVAVRHGLEACEKGAPDAAVVGPIAERLDGLRVAMGHVGMRAAPQLTAVAERYEGLAARIVDGAEACAKIRSAESRRERTELDEELTNTWISQMIELHKGVHVTGEQARRIGTRALGTGATASVLSVLAAALLARRMAQSVTSPLAALARAARRVGEGDFTAFPATRGPIEVVHLSRELDGMRARLAELDALKQGFIASVSHELRTPLTKVREALALLADGTTGPITERQARVIVIARQACEREIRIVSALLDLSRLRSGSPLKIMPGGSLDAVLRQAVAEEQGEATRRCVTVEVDAAGEAPPAALDEAMIECAIANLVRNAVSVSPSGKSVFVDRVVVDRGPRGQPGAWARVRVRDEGPGLSAEMRATLFKPFVTHSVREHPERIGVGLGLALAREVAQAHGGDVQVMDGTAPGATFALWIPLLRGARAPSMPPARGAQSELPR